MLCYIFSDVKLEDVSLEVMTNKWQNGDISNYDYLLYLNKYVCVGYYAHVHTFCWQIHVRNIIYSKYSSKLKQLVYIPYLHLRSKIPMTVYFSNIYYDDIIHQRYHPGIYLCIHLTTEWYVCTYILTPVFITPNNEDIPSGSIVTYRATRCPSYTVI